MIIKRKILFLYFKFLKYIKYIKYFFLKNFLQKTNYSFKSLPLFNQKTFIKGNGTIRIGKSCHFGYKMGGFNSGGSIEIQARSENSIIEIGDSVKTNNNIFICSMGVISIGNNCLIGQDVTIMDFEAHGIHPKNRNIVGEIGSIRINNNVWIGNKVIILKNSEIGDNSIVAAGSIVTGKFPNNVIIGGIPARIIKKIEI